MSWVWGRAICVSTAQAELTANREKGGAGVFSDLAAWTLLQVIYKTPNTNYLSLETNIRGIWVEIDTDKRGIYWFFLSFYTQRCFFCLTFIGIMIVIL